MKVVTYLLMLIAHFVVIMLWRFVAEGSLLGAIMISIGFGLIFARIAKYEE